MGTTLTWSAIVSTPTTNAITNVGSYGVPVYLPSGTLVASTDTTAPGGLWSGTLIHAITQDLIGGGTDTGPVDVGTGTTINGTGAVGAQLGTSSIEVGVNTRSDSAWISAGLGPPSASNSFFLYGISQVLTVPSSVAVPEPSTIWMAAGGICAGVAYSWSRRRRQQWR